MAKFILEEELEFDFKLLGISSHVQDYRLCWTVNRTLDLDLIKSDKEIIIRSNKVDEPLCFSNYYYQDFDSEVEFELNDVLHTFKKGHKIVVQVQSTWFPLVDINPQKYVDNIYKAKEELTTMSRKYGIHAIFFDGRGGSPARGGGKTHNFYASLGPTIEDKEVQLTIQGQTISSNFGTLIDILNFNTLSITNDNFLWSVVLNPTITGALTYTSITNSSIQHAVGSTQTITGGTVLDSGYVSANSSDKGSIKNAIRLGATIAGVADQLVFAVRPLSTNLDILGSVNWRELI